MNTTLSEQSISMAPDNPKWTEPLRDKPSIDPFPIRLLWKWLIPGIIGLTILLVIYGSLYWAANRQIVFLATNGTLVTMHADLTDRQDLAYRAPFQEWDISRQPSILPAPDWSPNGRYLASTVVIRDQERVAIFPSDMRTPRIITIDEQSTAVPGNGWSYSGRYLAVVTLGSEQSFVAVYDTRQQNYLSEPQLIDIRTGLNWSSQRDELLFTTYADEMAAPALHVVDADSNSYSFVPEDNQLMHADGVWSPNGQQIAYIASNTYTDTQDILWGNLWVANRDGQNPRLIAVGDNAFSPFWSPRGDYLYFTRFTRDARFELYRLATTGSAPREEYVGPSTDAVVLFPFHRNLLAQWSPNNKQMLFLGHGQATPGNYLSSKVNESIGAQISQMLPVKLISQWSPSGHEFAGTVVDGDATVVFVFDVATDQGLNYRAEGSDMLVFPANGWSPDSKYIALLRYDGTNTKLAVLDPSEGVLGTAEFDLNVKAGFSWNPNSTQLIATSLEEGITTSLKIYDVSANTVGDFEPEDGKLLHADGVWSPDGRWVVYIARDTLTDTLALDFLAGSLWIADSNGRSAQQIVKDGFNFAPIWSMDQQQIFFTRFMTETRAFDLYQVNMANRNVERLGLSTPEFAEFPFDRQTLLDWSPDGRHWLLPGTRVATQFILYSATADNTAVSKFPEQCNTAIPFTARWAPTNRGVLLACPSGDMFMRWSDQTRANTEFPRGVYPSWQP